MASTTCVRQHQLGPREDRLCLHVHVLSFYFRMKFGKQLVCFYISLSHLRRVLIKDPEVNSIQIKNPLKIQAIQFAFKEPETPVLLL